MAWLIILIYVIYYIFLTVIFSAWKKIRIPEDTSEAYLNFSVIIPVRNEAQNIADLLRDLDAQEYPENNFEVIVIDDNSTDTTADIIKKEKEKLSIKLFLLEQLQQNQRNVTGKKEAIHAGIKAAKGDYIIITDGDTRLGENWLDSYNAAFRQPGSLMIAGPVKYEKTDTLFKKMQQFDMSSLIGTSAAFIRLGFPVMCNGANMAFKKTAYFEVGGYQDNFSVKSGDDSFLLHKIHERYPGSVYFLKCQNAVVSTEAASTLSEFFNQRLRWAGKWNKYGLVPSVWLALFVFLTNLGILFSVYLVFSGEIHIMIFTLLFVLKIVMEGMFLKEIFVFLKSKYNPGILIVCSLLYPIYAVFFGLMANLRKYSWKGRTYKI